jgi:hypothetical protein
MFLPYEGFCFYAFAFTLLVVAFVVAFRHTKSKGSMLFAAIGRQYAVIRQVSLTTLRSTFARLPKKPCPYRLRTGWRTHKGSRISSEELSSLAGYTGRETRRRQRSDECRIVGRCSHPSGRNSVSWKSARVLPNPLKGSSGSHPLSNLSARHPSHNSLLATSPGLTAGAFFGVLYI